MVEFELDPNKTFRLAIAKAAASGVDLTVPFSIISREWFKGNKAIFTLKGPGKYADYKPGKGGQRPSPYEKFKIRHLGSQYPMMRLTGDLEASITDPTDQHAISYIINKNTLVLGTNVEYAHWLQDGTKNMQPRPVVLFGNEQVAPSPLNQRIENWRQMILKWVGDQMGAE